MRLCLPLAALLVTANVLPASAHAFGGAAAEFGHEGQWVPNGQLDFTLQHQNGADVTNLLVAPTLLYFITDHWAIGGGFTLGITSSNAADITTIGLQPTAAYHIPLTDNWTFFPQASFYVTSLGGDANGTAVGLQAYAPFLFHVASHFFAGIGPVLRFDIANDAGHAFLFGANSVIGGYF